CQNCDLSCQDRDRSCQFGTKGESDRPCRGDRPLGPLRRRSGKAAAGAGMPTEKASRRMIRLAISADGHVNEPADLWRSNLPGTLRDRAPRMEVRDGMVAMVVEDRVIRRLAKAPGLAEGTILGGESWGTNSPSARLEALAGDGVWAEVIYPS